MAAGDAFDKGLLKSHLLYELEHGPLDVKEARERRMYGGYIPTALYVDAMSVYAAVTAAFTKTPAEKSLLCHVQYLRELLDKHVLQHLVWIDARDMYADGLTKGAVSRTVVQEIMDGTMRLRHPCQRWMTKLLNKVIPPLESKLICLPSGGPSASHTVILYANPSARAAHSTIHGGAMRRRSSARQ